VELRDIEIFLILAEELHFGRTAQRLHVTQARVSQAISQQERRLGGALFDRSNRRQIRLTPLGRQLRDDLRPVYAGLRDSLERARLAARGITQVLHVGMIPSNAHELRPYWHAFRTRHPRWGLRITHVGSGELITVLGSHASRFHGRPDITYKPVRDSWTLRWRWYGAETPKTTLSGPSPPSCVTSGYARPVSDRHDH
jgi:DNA-binding transcriptional LysR family regulator